MKRAAFASEEYWGRPLPGFGDPQATVVVLGLAPAAHGGNRTGRVFTGDRSGDWLFAGLHRAGFANQPTSRDRGDGLKLRGCWVTAAVRCAPPANQPTPGERDACLPYAVSELELLTRARVIVCLGGFAWAAALRALLAGGARIPRPRPRFGHGACAEVGRFVLLGCYHPSQQNTFTGRLTESMMDDVLARARIWGGQGSSRPIRGDRTTPSEPRTTPSEPRPALAALAVSDRPEPWRALGFDVDEHHRIEIGAVAIQLGVPGSGITGWTLRDVDVPGDIDGLPTSVTKAPPPVPARHPNGATALDHVVITTPNFDRTAAALAHAGIALRRVRDAGGLRQGFRRLGPAIMEIVEVTRAATETGGARPPGSTAADGARFWGLVIIVADLDALHERLHPQLGDVRPAVQPGRRIATLSDTAGLSPRVAFMDSAIASG